MTETMAVLAGICTTLGSIVGGVAGFYIAMSKFVTKTDCSAMHQNDKGDKQRLHDRLDEIKTALDTLTGVLTGKGVLNGKS